MVSERFLLRAAFGALVSVLLAACGGGGAGNAPPFAPGTPAPNPTLTANPSSVAFSGTGAPYAQTVTVTASAPVSSVSVDIGSCGSGPSAIVTFGTPTGSGLSFSDTVTPQNPGSCTATVRTSSGASATVTFSVNSGSVTVTSHGKA
jgi:hypothetical protein